MSDPVFSNLLIIVVLSGPLLYIVVGWTLQRLDTEEEYFLARRTVQPHDFVGTTVAYGLQVAALTLFATWGYMYGFWTVLVPFFWFVGYLLLAYALSRGYVDRFIFQKHPGTIHQFIGENARGLAPLAAFASLIGITGPAMYEADFSSRIVVELRCQLIHQEYSGTLAGLLFLCFIAMSAVYILRGGFRAIVRTDNWQLAVGYVSVAIVTAALLFHVAASDQFWQAVILLTSLSVVSLVLFGAWLCLYRRLSLGLVVLAIATLVYLSVLCGVVFAFASNTSQSLSAGWTSFVGDQQVGNPLSLGFALVALAIANGLYQFVDVSQWQRLASVIIGDSEDVESQKTYRKLVSRSICLSGFYSSATWVVAVFLGMCLRYVAPGVKDDPYSAINKFLIDYQANQDTRWIVVVFILGIIGIMLSTLDSLMFSVTFTLRNDVLPRFGGGLRMAKIITGIVLAGGAVGYLYLLPLFVADPSILLYSCWATQIALFPVVVFSLTPRPMRGFLAIASVGFGMVAALIPFISLHSFPAAYQFDPYQYAAPFALVAAGAVSLLNFVPRSRQEQPIGEENGSRV